MEKIIKIFKPVVVPLGILCLALLANYQGWLNNISPNSTVYWFIMLLAIALVMSIGFKKSPFFFTLITVILNYLFQIKYPGAHAFNSSLFILLPLNIFLFALLDERGILTFWGKVQIGTILTEVVVIYCLFGSQLAKQPANAVFNPGFRYIIVGVLIVLLIGIGLKRHNRTYGVFTGVIITMCAGLIYADNALDWAILSSAAVIMIIVETIKDIYKLAFRDELTGLYSRRCFNLDQMRLHGIYSIAMLDIDHFKKINDNYGHDVGDQVLRYVTSFMRQTPRGTKAYRYGGEEFALVFQDNHKDEVVPYLEELRKIMSDRPFTLRSKDRPTQKPRAKAAGTNNLRKITVTVSIGVADSERKNYKPDDVIQAADKALYQAKKNGRNRTCVFK